MRRRFLTLIVTLLAIAAVAVTWHDTRTITVREIALPATGLTEPVTVLHVSDLHSTRFGEGQAGMEAALGDRRFDMIVVNGDHIAGKQGDTEPALELLTVLQHHSSTVFVTWGNHDTPEVIKALVADGAVLVLPEDEPLRYELPAGSVTVVPATRIPELPAETDVVLAMGHYPLTPDSIATVPLPEGATGVFLAGHTHGGQVRLPLLGAVWAPGPVDGEELSPTYHRLSDLFPELRGQTISGLSQVGDWYTHTSAGLGTQFLPIRFLCPAEVTVITFTPAD